MIDMPHVSVQVQSRYAETQSDANQARFVFAYSVIIRNFGRKQIQLLNRYWLITNGNGDQIEVQGKGVVGQQPIILPDSEFQYTSGAIIETPCGTMEGHYEMIDHQRNSFRVAIPVFRLAIATFIN